MGVAMGSLISGLIVEIFLQYYKNLIIKHVTENNHIIFYIWYVE
jgi:hypothetical protein